MMAADVISLHLNPWQLGVAGILFAIFVGAVAATLALFVFLVREHRRSWARPACRGALARAYLNS